MTSVTHYPVKILAVGFLVQVCFSLPLFWMRFLCEASLVENMPIEAKVINIQPSGLVPAELEEDPNIAHHSIVEANMNPLSIMKNPSMMPLGVYDDLIRKWPVGPYSSVYFFESDEECMYFDKTSGQIVCRYRQSQTMPDGSSPLRLVQFYIGPEGISEIPNEALGRFIDPIIDRGYPFGEMRKLCKLLLYDKRQQRFFRIDFDQRTVTKGPDIDKQGPPHAPIQIGRLLKKEFSSRIRWSPPIVHRNKIENRWQPIGRSRTKTEPIIPASINHDAGRYLLVLDETGRIDLLDKQTLEFAGIAGRLPSPETYFATKRAKTPKDLLAYDVQPLVLHKLYFEDGSLFKRTFGEPEDPEHIASRIDREYLGMFAAAVSRNGTAMALAVFNAEGKQIKTEYTRLPLHEGRYTSYLQSSRAAFWKAPWAPASTIGKYLAENLHPPILSLASYFIGSAFEAGSGHRALFLLPNSFVAMIGRDGRGNCVERFTSALWWMAPSIILAIWLACRVSKDAIITGFPRKARRYWIIGTIAFGLPAYITYRLTRPKTTLVTCINCGRPRRPDMDRCHRCGSPWHAPELTPPAWRVLAGTEQAPHNPSTKTNAAE